MPNSRGLPTVRAVFGKDGLPTGFYLEGINRPEQVPKDAVEIPYIAYLEFLQFQGQRAWDGKAITPYDPSASANLSRPPLPPEMVEEFKRTAEETVKMREAIVSVVTVWAGLENTLAHLLDSMLGSGLGMALYYTPTATETRLNLVDTAIVHTCNTSSYGKRTLELWKQILKRVSSAKNARNSIIHGNIVSHKVNNKAQVRLTRPMFDLSQNNKDMKTLLANVIKQIAGDTRQQYPGMSVSDVANSADNMSELAELIRIVRWPITVIRLSVNELPQSFHDTILQLEGRLRMPADPPIDALTPLEASDPLEPFSE